MQCRSREESHFMSQRAQRGYTLVELMVVVTIILVLASIGVFLYNRTIAHAKDTVCKTNLKTLNEAVILYLEENDAFPASLAQLRREHLERAYAKAVSEQGWYDKICLFLLKIDASENAHAQFLTDENLRKYGATQKVFHCPTVAEGAISYGINADLAGKRPSEISRDMILIADCDSHVFSSPDQIRRSHRGNKGFAVQKGGQVLEVKKSGGDVVLDPADTKETSPPASVESPSAPEAPPTPEAELPTNLVDSVKYFNGLVNSNRRTPTADKAEDVRNKLQSALIELSKPRPDTAAARGNLEGAEGELKAMIKDGLIDREEGAALLKVFRDISQKYEKLGDD